MSTSNAKTPGKTLGSFIFSLTELTTTTRRGSVIAAAARA